MNGRAYSSTSNVDGLNQKHSLIGTWERDIRTGRVFWSPGQHDIYGLDTTTFSPSVHNFLDFAHPKDQDFLVTVILGKAELAAISLSKSNSIASHIKDTHKVSLHANDIPVIDCTGHNSLAGDKNNRNMRFEAFMMNPVSNAKLSEVVRNVLDAAQVLC
ncbi:hypothetical protein [Desulfopila sp. IMCC35008]|uniref:hypothetical protein n=1 Tax=Desulfopila sp. IMCC35008 TaxID=2653858 RepID=UPI0013D61382|nr:hypothetical protein [Desulfopila sp. IMCC35008]